MRILDASIRILAQENEKKILCDRACLSVNSRGRAVPEDECNVRTCFQRDRDRIIHCQAFRRLKHKTQVFLAPSGDHYRKRLTHTLEVAQIARTIARALSLNEDLTEAVALGHDLGHTPFGHAGERALNQLCENGFRHYEQSVRVVERIEKNGKGLNLTDEVKNGLSEEDIPLSLRMQLGMTKSERINNMVIDVINNSKDKIRMSESCYTSFMDLHNFMFTAVYTNPVCKGEEKKAVNMLINIYNYYIGHIDEMPEEYINIAQSDGEERAVCDYIAGMSDTYALKIFNKLFVPMFWYD